MHWNRPKRMDAPAMVRGCLLYTSRPVEAGGVGERIGRLGIALCPWDVEAVLGKEAAEAPLVLENGHGFLRTGKGQAELLSHIGRRHDAGVAGEGHDAVDRCV